MLITTLRAPKSEYTAKAPVQGETAAQPRETFATASDVRLADVDAMRALALAAKTAEVKAELPEDLAAVVKAELGDSGITTFEEHRMQQMNGYVRDGWESPFFDAAKTLGEGWVEQEREVFPLFAPRVFMRQGENVTQILSFDQRGETTTLHTTHCESLISTRHHEIVQTRDGKVTITDETAV
jgi:hypothetical protein